MSDYIPIQELMRIRMYAPHVHELCYSLSEAPSAADEIMSLLTNIASNEVHSQPKSLTPEQARCFRAIYSLVQTAQNHQLELGSQLGRHPTGASLSEIAAAAAAAVAVAEEEPAINRRACGNAGKNPKPCTLCRHHKKKVRR